MNIKIAGRLADRRRDAGLSQEELAEKLGVSRQAVSKWERSESSPDTNNLIALAKLYDVSLDDLLYVDSATEDDIAFETEDRAQQECADNDGTADSASGDDADEGTDTGDDGDFVHISLKDGIHIKDGDDVVRVAWDGVHVTEDGETVFASDSIASSVWHGYEAGDVNMITQSKSAWLKFPFPLVTIIAYLLIGFLASEWLLGLSIFLLIPLYYMFVHACVTKSISSMLTTLYATAASAWFFYMGIVLEVWHPTWVVFLTIPIMAWLANTLFKRKPKK